MAPKSCCSKNVKRRGKKMLRFLMENLRMGLNLSSTITIFRVQFFKKKVEQNQQVVVLLPKDVKEGHFAVFVGEEGEEAKRFIVELSFLSNPAFLKLLEKAEEEFGFEQEGVLCLPCKPDELNKITCTYS